MSKHYDLYDEPTVKERQLVADLAAEREARQKAEKERDVERLLVGEAQAIVDLYGVKLGGKSLAVRVGELGKARLRAEAGAASRKHGLRRSKELLEHAMVVVSDADFHHDATGVIGMLSALLATDTGARLAAVVEEARKQGCLRIGESPMGYDCHQDYPDKPERWCTNCKLVAATGGHHDA